MRQTHRSGEYRDPWHPIPANLRIAPFPRHLNDTMRQLPLLTLVLATAAIIVHLLGQPFQSAMEYDRAAVAAGQFCRLVTCQWVHWSADHLFWDVCVFLAIGSACEVRDRRRAIAVTLLSTIGVPVAIHFLSPAITNFRGLSGIDSALFGLALVLVAEEGVRQRRWSMLAAGVAGVSLFIAKCTYELMTSKTLFVESSDFVVVPLAHVVGLAVGLGVAALIRLIRWRSKRIRVTSSSDWLGCRPSAAA